VTSTQEAASPFVYRPERRRAVEDRLNVWGLSLVSKRRRGIVDQRYEKVNFARLQDVLRGGGEREAR